VSHTPLLWIGQEWAASTPFLYFTDHNTELGRLVNQWEPDIARQEDSAMAEWRTKLADQVEFQQFMQWLFFTQWQALRRYANQRDIQIIGDIPIFVAYDSADVWANPDLFFLDQSGNPTVIAGVPPDFLARLASAGATHSIAGVTISPGISFVPF
jgi:4-alpha-glucanotransferase